MSSREQILNAIRQGKPEFLPLPGQIGFAGTYPHVAEQFVTVLKFIGGNLVAVNGMDDVQAYLQQHFDLTMPVVSLVEEVTVGNVFPALADDPHQFEDLHLVLLRANLGVAENGAVWVDERSLLLRVLPFITLNLAIVIREEELVANMHEAYEQLTFDTGYGAFIAGPSKTADIEQSLVIGAHGPKSMTVFLIRKAANPPLPS